ncbi:DNA replication factor C, large subunit [Yamadazyma tenuis ATCC 10573]|uniref:Replication factor C subunit 1 n=1 Tax=Candida tenuis (strain ATCC 10573 / BCRC 21748 / CBS 615 / JCM 9827 / NBRC 10315 / NRRL Y-1498 / VKM Y-70) TaxID=590646 RepID=G3BBY5_CANTC|nr:DNA replication factor C, large subunit [Yamadazyma tenuis ATCC 10573]EGV60115.1 DNA replication factor C, large subunit [Yamadazyma tenuis ATCC 10573]
MVLVTDFFKAKKPAAKREQPSPPSGASAEEILASIPDAELPDTSDSQKLSFFQLQQRKAQAPQATGSVDIPEAKPHCLSGLTMVFTGVLPNLERTDAENIAKRYGAKVPKSISGKTSVVVIGDEAGPSKVQKIKKMHIKAISEEGFLQLLRSMPADGGSGGEAVKAKRKREEEESRIIQEAEAEEEQERARQQQAKIQHVPPSVSKHSSRLPAEPVREISNDDKLWTTKYAPTSTLQLCGNKGQVNKLRSWLLHWFDNAKNDFKDPGADGSGVFRACLISGPPGIGKTTAAHLIAEDLGFDVLEKNASDVRSKSLLNSDIKSVLNNTSVMGFFQNRHADVHQENERRFCLIMDEVDGMSSGDHGGAGALSQFCRITKMPMILICNDKSLPKMRTFDRVTYDLAFRRPSENEVKARIMTICHREKIKIDPSIIGQLVQTTNNDIRQMINLLSTVSKTQKTIGAEQSKDFSKSWQKQTVLKPFDIVGKLLNGQIYSPHSNHTLNDKIDLYFNDIDFTPLMVQENYLYTRPSNCRDDSDHLRRVAQAADDISASDRINSLIRSSEQQWSLLPFHAVMSSVKPSREVAGNISQRINFAGWLGQNSKQMKYQRLLQELQYHTRLRTSTDKKELRLEYVPLLAKRLAGPIVSQGENGIQPCIDVMDYYFLTREDWDTILDFGVGAAKGEAVLKKIPTKVKTAFTRTYNSSTHPIAIYKTGNSVGTTKSTASTVDYEDVIQDDTLKDDDDTEEKDDSKFDSKKDKLIKEVKPKKGAKRSKK